MLGTLRKHSKSVIVYVLFGIIIVVFVFTFNVATPDLGCGGTGNKRAQGSLVTIDEIELGTTALNMGMNLSAEAPPVRRDKLDANQLRKELIYRTTRFWVLGQDQKYRIFNPDPKTVSMIKIRKVMDDLEETYLVSNEAMRRGLFAAPKDVANAILKRFTDPEKGGFQSKYYHRWVRYNLGTTIQKFEDFVGRELLRQRMIDIVTAPVVLSDRDKNLIKKFAGVTLNCDYIQVSPEKLSMGTTITEQAAADYLKKHAAEVKQYFETHQDAFHQPDKFKIHLFQVKAPSRSYMKKVSPEVKKNLEAEWENAKKNADAYYEQLKNADTGKIVQTFETLAKEKSDNEATRDNGGRIDRELTLKDLSQFDPAVAAWAATAGANALSKPIAGDEGYYICRIDSVKRGGQVTFEDVKIEAAKALLARKSAKDHTKETAQAVLQMAKANPDKSLAEIAKQFNDEKFRGKKVVTAGTTGEFSPVKVDFASIVDSDPAALPSIGVNEELASTLLTLNKNALAPKVYNPEGSRSYFVVRLTDKKQTKPDKDKLQSLFDTLLRFKKVAAYRGWYNALRTQAIKTGKLVEHQAFMAMLQQQIKAREEEMKRSGKSLRMKLNNLK